MKKYITLLSIITALAVHADNDIHLNESLSGDYSGESHVDSSWIYAHVTEGNSVIFSTSDSKTNYTRANFGSTRLDSASFRSAILTNASFSGATLKDTDFTDATITGVSFDGVKSFTEAQLKSTKSYKEKNLSGITLSYNDLSGWDFNGQNLWKARFQDATLANTNFTNADLTSANFGGAILTNAIFKGADLTSASLRATTLTNADFTDAIVNGINFYGTVGFTQAQLKSTKSYKEKNLSGVNFQYIDGLIDFSGLDFSGFNLTSADFGMTILKDVDFTDAIITGASFYGSSDFTKAQLKSTKNYKEKDLSGINLNFNDWSDLDFKGFNLTSTVFRGAFIKNADFTDAIITGADFGGSQQKGFTKTQLESTKSYKEKDLTGIRLDCNNMHHWDFSGFNLTSANFYHATLSNTDFTDTILTNAELSYANFTNATLTNTDFTNANVEYANFSGTVAKGFTEAQLKLTESYKEKNLRGINLSSNDLSGWGFNGQRLDAAIFQNATLANADFTDTDVESANFSGTVANGFTEAQLKSTKNYKEKNLRGINLSSNDLSGWDFNGQRLHEAKFENATLTNTDFTDTDVRSANFSGTVANGFTEAQLKSTKSYKEKNLSEINLSSNNLSGWDFNRQGLQSANFQNATLTNTIFNEANLNSATFRNAILTNTDFTNASFGYDTDFTDADVRGANFSGTVAKYFYEKMLKSTKSYKEKNLSGINLSSNDLSGWDFNSQGLHAANFQGTTLTNTIFKRANLDSANFTNATFTNTDFTNANVEYANFSGTVANGFTEAQLKLTKSYKEKNLNGINLSSNDLSGWNFNGQGLQAANFQNAILTNTIFKRANLNSANFTNANVEYANFSGAVANGFTEAQLKSTKSYKEKNLSGINLSFNNLSGWGFNGQGLKATNFQNAILTNTDFTNATLNDTDFMNADLRGATLTEMNGTPIYKNTIMSNGVIKNFSMNSSADNLVIHAYESIAGSPTISAKIAENAVISGGAKLTLERGARLEVVGKTLTIGSDGLLQIDTDLNSSTFINVNDESSISFHDGATFTVNIIDDITTTDTCTFAVMSFEDESSRIAGLNDLIKNETFLLNINGEKFNGAWDYTIQSHVLLISLTVPEPATVAAILGVLALGFAVYRRRK